MNTPVDPKAGPPGAPRSGGRRRLLAGGLAAGPVLMTVASRPVLGQTANCTSFGVWNSIQAGTSLHQGCASMIGGGYSPDDWMSRTSAWPTPYTAT